MVANLNVRLAIMIAQWTIERLERLLLQAKVDLRDDRHTLLAVHHTIDGSGDARALLDRLVEGLDRVGLARRGHDTGGREPLVNLELLEGGERVVEVGQLILEQGRVDRAGAVFAVLVRPEHVVGRARLERLPVRDQLSLDRLEKRRVERLLRATILRPAAVVVLGPGAMDRPLVLVLHTALRLAERFRPLGGQQDVIKVVVLAARQRGGGNAGQQDEDDRKTGHGSAVSVVVVLWKCPRKECNLYIEVLRCLRHLHPQFWLSSLSMLVPNQLEI